MSFENLKTAIRIIVNELVKPLKSIYDFTILLSISRYYESLIERVIDSIFPILELKKILNAILISLTTCGMALAASSLRTVLVLKEISIFYQILVVFIPFGWTLFFFTPLMKKCIAN